MEASTTPIINSGLFSLCDDFDKDNEETKETIITDKNIEELYLNYKDCILDKSAYLGGKNKKGKDNKDSETKLDESLYEYKQNILDIRKKLKADKSKEGK